ncbi:DNA/RNA helicase domain-containing protein [Paenibacillus sp. OV219]|uniref:DNA/RNA helicase domain-containing protein n=1 Tax=Paenibacillus sp. OV219 TaxID=1884377 RepID=UPI0008C2F53A|nr:DNA/RNA helicase domain-containing protein [Paenibacillus sp. OV219]SEO55199.1 Thymidylate kinase [Paenibacillus sp. OV219]
MQNTQLIMIEGIPGSGKSTTAQLISNELLRMGLGHKWWYEEVKGHPVYIYENYNEMQTIIEDLTSGNYQKVIDRALKKWREFADSVQLSNEIVIVDSCLFGYLTWTLFPFEVPVQEIEAYVKAVEQMLKPLNPAIIYFYQIDIGAALKNICTRRGGETEQHFIRASTGSAYGKSRGLDGFEGMVAYWKDYRTLTDTAFQSLACNKISINNSEGNWPQYARMISDFLGFDNSDVGPMVERDPKPLLGDYQAELEGIPDCSIQFESGHLIADGLPQVWTRSILIPRAVNVYDVQSLPFQVRFIEDEFIRLCLTGPALLDGPVDYRFVKKVGNR